MDVVDLIGGAASDDGTLGVVCRYRLGIGGGGALLTGLHMKRTRKLERLLDKMVGDRDNILCRNCLPPPGWTRPGDVLP